MRAPGEADFQIAATQNAGDAQLCISNDSDQLVLGCSAVGRLLTDQFAEKCVALANRKFLDAVMNAVKEIPCAESVENAEKHLANEMKDFYNKGCCIRLNYNPLSHSIFQDALKLGTGMQLRRRQLYYFTLQYGNDYCKPLR